MGAYEFHGIIYVDNQGLDDTGQDDRIKDGSVARPFDSIQEAIDVAKDGQTILVRPGVYNYPTIDFNGPSKERCGYFPYG
jgi:hypothetical protein